VLERRGGSGWKSADGGLREEGRFENRIGRAAYERGPQLKDQALGTGSGRRRLRYVGKVSWTRPPPFPVLKRGIEKRGNKQRKENTRHLKRAVVHTNTKSTLVGEQNKYRCTRRSGGRGRKGG